MPICWSPGCLQWPCWNLVSLLVWIEEMESLKIMFMAWQYMRLKCSWLKWKATPSFLLKLQRNIIHKWCAILLPIMVVKATWYPIWNEYIQYIQYMFPEYQSAHSGCISLKCPVSLCISCSWGIIFRVIHTKCFDFFQVPLKETRTVILILWCWNQTEDRDLLILYKLE